MTHEQKPQSAEFRAQKWDGLPENQTNDGWHWLTHEITHSPTPYLWKASAGVWIGDGGLQFYPNSVWCARRQYIGRAQTPAEEEAEQRQKDAEGAEQPTCYVNADRLRWHLSHGGSYMTTVSAGPVKASVPHHNLQDGLYLRPANVAALEARVKELEGVLVEIANNKTNDCPKADGLSYLERLGWAVEWCRRKARAAIREGGGS